MPDQYPAAEAARVLRQLGLDATSPEPGPFSGSDPTDCPQPSVNEWFGLKATIGIGYVPEGHAGFGDL